MEIYFLHLEKKKHKVFIYGTTGSKAKQKKNIGPHKNDCSPEVSITFKN